MNGRMENWNYYNDARTQGPARKPKLYVRACTECCTLDEKCSCDADMCDLEIELPTRWEVCPVCEGRGEHVNPSIDAGGLSRDAFDDEEFAENYRAGVYDVPCNHCAGRTTVAVVDESKLDPDALAAWRRQCREEDADRRCQIAELAMGC